jgi:hypothetical protein
MYLMLGVITSKDSKINNKLLMLGITIGLAMMSKIHGVYLWIGFLAYIIFYRRDILFNPALYISGILTGFIFLPAVLWTISNKFSTLKYHGGRVSLSLDHLQPDSFLRELSGSILYNNPVVFVLIVTSVIFIIKHKPANPPEVKLFFFLALPLIVTILIISVFNDTLPHWTGPAYLSFIPLVGLYFNNRRNVRATANDTPHIIKAAISLTFIFLLLAGSLINYFPGSLGKKQMPDFGANDVTLDMCGWKQFGKDFRNLYETDKKHKVTTGDYIFSDYWFPAAHLDFYVATPLHLKVFAVGRLNDIHHFAWLNALHNLPAKGTDNYFIAVSNFYKPPPPAVIKCFEHISAPILISQHRSGVVVRYFYIYRLIGYKGGLPANGVIEE